MSLNVPVYHSLFLTRVMAECAFASTVRGYVGANARLTVGVFGLYFRHTADGSGSSRQDSTYCKGLSMPANHTEIEKRLWDADDELRANSKLKSSEYSVPVWG